jgi:pyruvate/2-oxoglutarate dehydrogenase complex dihydrolipoamide acyltransferase (E2) component
VGMMPKFINKASPWHSSIFLTNIGSIGVESIYHHLYEFGTCSMFCAMGKKTRRHTVDKNGDMNSHKSIQLKFVLDERICDGFYYASSMRLLNKILSNPASLLLPPEQVNIDEGVGKKRIDI